MKFLILGFNGQSVHMDVWTKQCSNDREAGSKIPLSVEDCKWQNLGFSRPSCVLMLLLRSYAQCQNRLPGYVVSRRLLLQRPWIDDINSISSGTTVWIFPSCSGHWKGDLLTYGRNAKYSTVAPWHMMRRPSRVIGERVWNTSSMSYAERENTPTFRAFQRNSRMRCAVGMKLPVIFVQSAQNASLLSDGTDRILTHWD
jgi:hypothetical protein